MCTYSQARRPGTVTRGVAGDAHDLLVLLIITAVSRRRMKECYSRNAGCGSIGRVTPGCPSGADRIGERRRVRALPLADRARLEIPTTRSARPARPRSRRMQHRAL